MEGAAGPPRLPGQAPPVRPLILLVDDDVHLLALLGSALQAADFEVRLATSAQMAMQMLAEPGCRPNLALVDLHMPAMSGLQLMRASADSGSHGPAALPFMLMSASASEVFVQRAAGQGALGYLVKPIDLAQLLPAVTTALARSQQIASLHETAARLQAALLSETETAMAIGVLMARFGVDRARAHGALHQHARANQRSVLQVAGDVLAQAPALVGIGHRLRQ